MPDRPEVDIDAVLARALAARGNRELMSRAQVARMDSEVLHDLVIEMVVETFIRRSRAEVPPLAVSTEVHRRLHAGLAAPE